MRGKNTAETFETLVSLDNDSYFGVVLKETLASLFSARDKKLQSLILRDVNSSNLNILDLAFLHGYDKVAHFLLNCLPHHLKNMYYILALNKILDTIDSKNAGRLFLTEGEQKRLLAAIERFGGMVVDVSLNGRKDFHLFTHSITKNKLRITSYISSIKEHLEAKANGYRLDVNDTVLTGLLIDVEMHFHFLISSLRTPLKNVFLANFAQALFDAMPEKTIREGKITKKNIKVKFLHDKTVVIGKLISALHKFDAGKFTFIPEGYYIRTPEELIGIYVSSDRSSDVAEIPSDDESLSLDDSLSSSDHADIVLPHPAPPPQEWIDELEREHAEKIARRNTRNLGNTGSDVESVVTTSSESSSGNSNKNSSQRRHRHRSSRNTNTFSPRDTDSNNANTSSATYAKLPPDHRETYTVRRVKSVEFDHGRVKSVTFKRKHVISQEPGRPDAFLPDKDGKIWTESALCLAVMRRFVKRYPKNPQRRADIVASERRKLGMEDTSFQLPRTSERLSFIDRLANRRDAMMSSGRRSHSASKAG